MLSGIIAHIIGDNGFQTIYTPLRIKEMNYMLTIYIYNTLIDNEYFVITEAEDDIGVSVRLHMRIDRDWVIMDIPIYPTSRHY